ncbi:hypothetical protein SI65_10318 [Aspergillus cristatus]|uniref:Subtelomeric hrmA-associated cluster protein AFUB-079030/YDR124W-like helical bundle domain-containing protein n=1 Tax=Aspergillus cristatus TaxID=573508 RepID=A0A1E3B008_ASPCR|nr:hypothetical protein SI65_10318 [Aspergillus cristatus]
MNPAYAAVTTGPEMPHQSLSYDDGMASRSTQQIATTQQTMLNIPYSHYAILYMDGDGKLGVEVSPSIEGSEKAIFTQDVRGRFLRSVTGGPYGLQGYSNPMMQTQDGILPSSTSLAWYHHSRTKRDGLIPCEWQSQRSKRQRRRDSDSASASPCPTIRRTALRVGDHDLLRRYYEKAFDNFQQLNCRMIAKAWIKLVEPRKQVNHPYNGRKNVGGTSQRVDPELTKPRWWPTGVTHKEPDHLPKPERVRLLIHILCELRVSHDITAEKLKEAGQDVRRQISPAERLEVLDEIYYVRQMEEHYLAGDIGSDTILHVSHVHLPEASFEFDQHDFQSTDHHDTLSSIPTTLPKVPAMRSTSDDGSPEYCLPLTPSSSCPSNGPRSPAQTHPSYSPEMASSMMSTGAHASAAYVTSKDESQPGSCMPDYFSQPFLVPTTAPSTQAGYWGHPAQAHAPVYPTGY